MPAAGNTKSRKAVLRSLLLPTFAIDGHPDVDALAVIDAQWAILTPNNQHGFDD
jgi:hypothetical protein